MNFQVINQFKNGIPPDLSSSSWFKPDSVVRSYNIKVFSWLSIHCYCSVITLMDNTQVPVLVIN